MSEGGSVIKTSQPVGDFSSENFNAQRLVQRDLVLCFLPEVCSHSVFAVVLIVIRC